MWQVLCGDILDKIKEVPNDSVQCCITSPPYWQLRDYGNEEEIGSEATPEEFVAKLTEVFAEVKRTLRPDGILWLNLGDGFCGGGGYCPGAPSNLAGSKQSTNRGVKNKSRPVPPGYKPKDLVGAPWMLALSLRKAGWWLRDDVIWDKPNGMPEKVTDRPARTHEYVFLLTKNKTYHFDHLAIQEDAVNGGKRNRRSVWSIPQKAYPGAHFAVFPEELVRLCLLSGTKENDVVLDPFNGSGTTGAVAVKLGRDFIGIDKNPAFCEMASQRIQAAVDSLVSGG